ncbi:hypothetical protein [Agrobacterium rosae]|uniref:hypothetical protein n=1 Tax=Agrobacterium rosae TaxID=1972867 RepID=UPI003BA044E4
MAIYFPERFAQLQRSNEAAMSRMRKMAIAAVQDESDVRMEKAYVAVLNALTESSFGGISADERNYRDFLARQLEDVCLRWKEAGEVVHDVKEDLSQIGLSSMWPFDDLFDSGAFEDVSYVHLGEVSLTGAALAHEAHLDGFFIQPATVGDMNGIMLTFTCSSHAEHEEDLGSLLRARSRMARIWMSNSEDNDGTIIPQVSGDLDLVRDRTLPRALGLAAGAIRLIGERDLSSDRSAGCR